MPVPTNSTMVTSHSQFVGSQIVAVDWQKQNGLQKPEFFASGSWNAPEIGKNMIQLWHISPSDETEENVDRLSAVANFEIGTDVVQIKFMDSSLILAGHGDSLTLLRASPDMSQLEKVSERVKWHEHECTCFSVSGTQVASCSSDGHVKILDVNVSKGLSASAAGRAHEPVAAITCCEHMTQSTLVTGTVSGHLHVWDTRDRSVQGPVSTVYASQSLGITSCASRPSQPHLVALGTQNGQIGFVDLRQTQTHAPETLPIADAPIWKIAFHPEFEENGFSCDQNGQLIQWDLSAFKDANIGLSTTARSESNSGSGNTLSDWLTSADVLCERMQLSTLHRDTQAVHCLALSHNRVLVGSDSATITLLENVQLK